MNFPLLRIKPNFFGVIQIERMNLKQKSILPRRKISGLSSSTFGIQKSLFHDQMRINQGNFKRNLKKENVSNLKSRCVALY